MNKLIAHCERMYFDEAVLEADESRVPILDADPESAYVRLVKQLLEKLPVEVVKQAH